MYVLRGNGESHAAWATRMRRDLGQRLLRLGPSKLQLTVTEAPPPKLSLFPFKDQPIAIFNVYGDSDDPSAFTDGLREAASSVSGYEVEEAYPVHYEKAWSDGEPTPSPILLTMLHKKAGVPTRSSSRAGTMGIRPSRSRSIRFGTTSATSSASR